MMDDGQLSPAGFVCHKQALAAKARDDLAGAEAAYRKWLRWEPRNPLPAYGLALMLLRRGEYEEGFRLYESRYAIRATKIWKPEWVPQPVPLGDGPWDEIEIELPATLLPAE